MNGLNYIKMPRNVTQYSLMRGVTDFSNLRQFDLFESGYSFLTVVSVPRFMTMLAKKNDKIEELQNGFIHILESEFRGLDGIPDIQADAGTITNGANEIQLINNVTMDTSIQVSMSFYERSGSIITNYINYYLTGIKDPYSKAKTYHGLVGVEVTDPGPDYEVFTFLYYVTDNTMRSLEKAYLLTNAQPILAPNGTLYGNTQRGQHEFQELSLTFNCFPIVSDRVNKYAAQMLTNDITYSLDENGNVDKDSNPRAMVLDSNEFGFDVFKNKVEGENALPDISRIINTTKLNDGVLLENGMQRIQYGAPDTVEDKNDNKRKQFLDKMNGIYTNIPT